MNFVHLSLGIVVARKRVDFWEEDHLERDVWVSGQVGCITCCVSLRHVN